MNTPASSAISSSSSDTGNGSSPPSTPIREYQFHRTVRNTYGRAKPSTASYTSSSSSPFSLDPPSSPDPWASYSISLSNNNSPLQQRRGRSRLSGSFSDLASTTSDPWDTPTRGTRTLTEKLARAKLDFQDSDSDNDNNDGKSEINRSVKEEKEEDEEEEEEEEEDCENVFLVRNSKSKPEKLQQERDHRDAIGKDVKSPKKQTPKRKREALETIIRQSPRLRKTLTLEQESDSDHDQNTRGNLGSLGRLSPRSLSPGSPPRSPCQRSSKRSRTANIPVVLLPEAKTTTAKPKMNSATSTVISDGAITGTEKKLPQQVTLASFFTTKAGSKGTGILKGRASSTKEGSAGITNTAEVSAASVIPKANNSLARNPPSSSQEPPKKLEQLFLSFSKDRTKSSSTPLSSSTSSPSKTSNGATLLSNRKPAARLQREDEKSKRYHCPQCGMPYVRGQSEDEQIHDRYHRAVLGGVDYPGYKNEIVVATYSDLKVEQHHVNKNATSIGGSVNGNGTPTAASELSNSRIVMVSMSDPGKSASSLASGGSGFEKRKVKEVLQVVNKELGSVDFEPEQLDSCKVFLYVSGKKKVIGCVIAERIKQGFEIISHANTKSALPPSASSEPLSEFSATDDSLPPISTTETISAPSSQRDHGGGSAIFCSTVPCPAICGINRIWVSAHCRRQGIASRLLDAVRDRFIYACKLQKTDLAFSQPTGDGKALARQYLGTDKFLVYVE
ncbi:N-acetyltransferase esco2 [Mortierella sp. AD094]|nr:N-acetyltransferase esco2 [Mortierella sp. AD094]